MQSVTSRIWTRVAVSISYDDNDYTTGTSIIELGNARNKHLSVFLYFFFIFRNKYQIKIEHICIEWIVVIY